MRDHLDTLGALRAVAEGVKVPREKYHALERAALIRVRRRNDVARDAELTEAGRERLASPPPAGIREAG